MLIQEQGKPEKPSGNNAINAASGTKRTTARSSGKVSGEPQRVNATPSANPIGTAEEVMKFQDWLDSNHPGWAEGYPDNVLKKRKGYGNFGRLTKRAWEQHGEAYKAGDSTKQTSPMGGSGQPLGEDDWFAENQRTGNFTNGRMIDINYGNNTKAWAKTAEAVGDNESPRDSQYLFFRDMTWIMVNKKPNGKYGVSANGKYDFGKNEMLSVDDDGNEIQLEQRIISRSDRQSQNTNKASAAQVKPTYRKFFARVGIMDDPAFGNKPNPELVKSVYNAVIQVMDQGWQGFVLGYFKEGLKNLVALYPDDYHGLDPERISGTGTVEGDRTYQGGYNATVDTPSGKKLRLLNYPSNEINLLSDPQNKEGFQSTQVRRLITLLKNNTHPIYRWKNISSAEGGENVMGVKYGDVTEQDCNKALLEWYTQALSQTKGASFDRTSGDRIKEYLQACNGQCMYSNKDGNFFRRLSKNKVERSAKQMMEELKRTSMGNYFIPFTNMDDKCRSMGKAHNVANKTFKDSDMESSSNIHRESYDILKKALSTELLIEEKRREKFHKMKTSKDVQALVENVRNFKSQHEFDHLFNLIVSESTMTGSLDEQAATSNFLSGLAQLGFGGVADTLQEKFAAWLLKVLGLDPNSWLGSAFTVGFANFDINNMSKILSGDCSSLVKFLAETTVEAIWKRKAGGDTTVMGDILRNSMMDVLFKDKSELTASISDKFMDYVCPKLQKVGLKYNSMNTDFKKRLLSN